MRLARIRSRARDVDLAEVFPRCFDRVAFRGGERTGVGFLAGGERLAVADGAGLEPFDPPCSAGHRAEGFLLHQGYVPFGAVRGFASPALNAFPSHPQHTAMFEHPYQEPSTRRGS